MDTIDEQRAGLAKRLAPSGEAESTISTRWVWFPWRRCAVHLLAPPHFDRLRLDRNRNKITPAEQARLRSLTIAVVGLSVGHPIAYTLALEGLCGRLRLADFDEIELSNLNRIPASLVDLGRNKAVVTARRIAELDPYLDVEIDERGVVDGNLDALLDGVDVLIEECDSLDVKLRVRSEARRRGIPVLMETSDLGLFDVERFDLEPNRLLLHGLVGEVDAESLRGLSTEDKVPYVLSILEAEQLSTRFAASLVEVDRTVSTWPQLGGDVTLGAATVAAAVRRFARGRACRRDASAFRSTVHWRASLLRSAQIRRPLTGRRGRSRPRHRRCPVAWPRRPRLHRPPPTRSRGGFGGPIPS